MIQCHLADTHWHRLPSQNYETLRALHHETCKLMAQDSLYLVGLLDLNADSDGVNGWLDVNTFILVSRDRQRIEKYFL